MKCFSALPARSSLVERRRALSLLSWALSAFEPARGAFSCCEASRLSSFQNTERDGYPAHVVKAPRGGGNVLAYARSGAEEVRSSS